VTKSDSDPAKDTKAVPFARKRNQYRNLALQGSAELVVPCADSVPVSDYYVAITNDAPTLRRPHSSETKLLSAQTISELVDQRGQAPVDLVVMDDSCIDLSFRLPDATLPELRQIIENELQFRSPFSENASYWFWTGEEQEDGRWRARASVVLKNRVQEALDLLSQAEIPVGMVRRSSPEVEFAARPAWAGHEANTKSLSITKNLPAALKLSLLGAAVYCASAIALLVSDSLTRSDVAQQAATARATLSQQAQSAAGVQKLDQSLQLATEKLAITGKLSQLLPEGVWLDQLIIDDDTVTLAGFGPSAAEITQMLTTLPELTDIRFASPVTRDNSQSLERFRIAATLTGAAP
jgi:hypothetical protein